MYINPYSRIFNPATGRTVNVMSKVGKNVLNGYINELQGGYDYYDDQNYDESQLGGYDDYNYQDYDDQSQNNMNGGSAGPGSTPVRVNSRGEPIVPRPFEPPSKSKKIKDWLKEMKNKKE